MTPLLAQGDSSITDTDRKIEALLQLHENKLLKMRIFELETYKRDIREYMLGRDFLISQLYDEIWILDQKGQVHVAEKQKQTLLIKDLQEVNLEQRQKITRKNKTILILVGIDIVILGTLILLK